jgi:CRP-like cAMP-binding protein
MPIDQATARLCSFRIFEDLDPEEIEAHVAGFVQERTASRGTILFRQGDVPDFFYLVERGQVVEEKWDPGGKVLLQRYVSAGDFFGRRALMESTPRQTTASVTDDAWLLMIPSADFQTLLAMFPDLRERLKLTHVVNRLLAIPLFGSFSEAQLQLTADLAHEVRFASGAVLFDQGDVADAFYVIDTGQVIELGQGSTPGATDRPQYLSAGSWFGHDSLAQKETIRHGTATAASQVNLFRFGTHAFEWFNREQAQFGSALKRPDARPYLDATTLFGRLSEEERRRLCGFLGLAHFRPGDIVYRQGQVDPTLYILSEGEAILRARDESGRERPRGYLVAGEIIGERSLFLAEPRDVTVESTTSSNWFYLTRQDLDTFLAQNPQAGDALVLMEEVEIRRHLQRYDWLEPEERVVLQRRRHWFFLMRRLLLPAAALLPGLALLLSGLFLGGALLQPLGLLFLVPALFGIAWRVVDWLNDYYVITTRRVLHREKTLLVRESRDETPLDKVQNINAERGLIGHTFGFGTLVIDTAAAIGATRVRFDYLPEPDKAQQIVLEQMHRVRAGRRTEVRQAIRSKLEARVGVAIQPKIPKPAVPVPEAAPTPVPARQRPGRASRFELPNPFWIEQRTEDRVTWRKHWIRLLIRTGVPSVVLMVLVLALVLNLAAGVLQPLLALLLLGLLGPAALWWWWNYADWGNDQYIVTNDRIIDTERLPLGFRTRLTETTFDKVQNVSFEVPNPIATLLNVGTVFIFTAGREGRLDFQWVRDPRGVQNEVFRRLTAYQDAQRRQQQQEYWEDLPEWFEAYARLRGR